MASQFAALIISIIARVFSLNFSDKTTDELESLKRRFSSFKQRFDRGVAAQTGLTVEELKEQLNLILDDSGAHTLCIKEQDTQKCISFPGGCRAFAGTQARNLRHSKGPR
jgi:hypothetical protein